MKQLVRRVRAVPALNTPTTALVRAMIRNRGGTDEWVINHLPRSGRVTARLPNGGKMVLWSHADEWTANQIYWRGWGGVDPETTPAFFEAATNAGVVLDVGANVGFYAITAALANPSGQVVAFEPLPKAHARLVRNVALSAARNVRCELLALGRVDGTAPLFHVEMNSIPMASTLDTSFLDAYPRVATEPVRVMRGDEYVRLHRLDRVDLIKLDTECTEPDVLLGLAETVADHRPRIFCEVLPGQGVESRLESILSPLGYKYIHLSRTGRHPRPAISGDAVDRNWLFEPQ